jgi:hypothetical protein
MHWSAWVVCAGSIWLSACGSDETLAPAPAAQMGDNADAGVDVCGALNALFSVPGVPERLCALNQGSPQSAGAPQSGASQSAVQQCQVCAATTTALDALLPALSCPTQLEECPVQDATLRQCFKDVGQIMSDTMPGCAQSESTTLDSTQLTIRIATSSCGPVLLACPPLQALVLGLLGATF